VSTTWYAMVALVIFFLGMLIGAAGCDVVHSSAKYPRRSTRSPFNRYEAGFLVGVVGGDAKYRSLDGSEWKVSKYGYIEEAQQWKKCP
jgi:hypothetical protein